VHLGTATTVGAFYGAVVPWSSWYYSSGGLSEYFFPGWGALNSSFYAWDSPAYGYGGSDWGQTYDGGHGAVQLGVLGWAGPYDAWGLYDPLALYAVPGWAWGGTTLWHAHYTGLVPQLPGAELKIDVDKEISKFENHVRTAVQYTAQVAGALTWIDEAVDIAVTAATGLVVVGASSQLPVVQENDGLARYGMLSETIRMRLDAASGVNWSGAWIRRTLERLDATAAEFLATHVRLQQTSGNGQYLLYTLYETTDRGVPYLEDPANNWREFLRSVRDDESDYLIHVELPTQLNELEAISLLLGQFSGDPVASGNVGAAEIATLYRDFVSDKLGKDADVIEDAIANTRARGRTAGEQASSYAMTYYSTVGTLSLGGGVAMAIYTVEAQGLLAGAIEMALISPIGKIFRGAKLLTIKTGKVVAGHLPRALAELYQSGRAVGGRRSARPCGWPERPGMTPKRSRRWRILGRLTAT
jgi:hypothetical protein